MLYVFDIIYLYDPDDRQYECQVREINTRALGTKRGKVSTQIICTIMRPAFKGDRRVEIRDDEVVRPGWQWSQRPIPEIRKNAVVIIENWGHQIECRVHGVVEGTGGFRGDDFALEGVRAVRRMEPHMGTSLGRIKGHHFTASTDSVIKIIKKGTGRRLLLCDFMSKKEHREFFKDIY